MRATSWVRSSGGEAFGEHGQRSGLDDPVGEPALDAAHAGRVQVLGERPHAGTLGHDRAERARVRRRLEQQLAADGEPEAADAVGVDVRPTAEEPHGGGTSASPPQPKAL